MNLQSGLESRRRAVLVGIFLFLVSLGALSQDSVDVTFRYKPPVSTQPYLAGEFNGWTPADQSLKLGYQGSDWTVTKRLRLGGNPSPSSTGIPGAWQYKFYYANASPWPNDPLDHHVNVRDNSNSYLYTKDPTIYQLLPNQRSPLVQSNTPTVSAYIFPKVGAGVDTSRFSIKIDGSTVTGIGASYNPSTKQFAFTPRTSLMNGSHTLILTAGSTTGGMNSDTVTFITQAGFVQITSKGGVSTRNPQRQIRGIVQDTSIHLVRLVRNDKDTSIVSVAGGSYVATATLSEGINTFKTMADSGSSKIVSDSVTFSYIVNHSPSDSIAFISIGSQILLSARSSSDPDSGQTSQLTFQWSADETNPQSLTIANASGIEASVSRPTTPGEYFFTLIVGDPNGNKDTTRNFFTILKDGSFQYSTLASVPEWVKRGRVYEMFFKSLTPEGTINAALEYLPYLKSLGVNILWLMPIMENAAPINNGPGPGYNISNFVKVAPEYGTNDDFKNFVRQAHLLGLKVILDVTPNHTSSAHPFAMDATLYRENSPYWNFYQHTIIPHNDNGLGQTSSGGFVHYDGWDQLLNYDWSDIDARYYMTEVYKWWVKEFGIDGYRLDVYWGPSRRYGEQTFGNPLRRALKHFKPDLYLLAECDGTGSGSEVIFADQNGGADSGYDWILYGSAIKPFYSSAGIEGLHAKIYNNNYYPGSNASTLRFLENHDEERIAYQYGSYEKTMPIGTVVFTAPGMPMLYSGQEVGFGSGINDFDQRRRGVINWNNAGKNLLMPHYQKLASIRAQFPAFSSQQMTRIASGNSSVYSYSRPFAGADGLVAVNVSATSQDVTLPLGATSLASLLQDGKTYYASDLYNDTAYAVVFSGGNASLSFRLPPYGSRVCVLSDSVKRLTIPVLVSVQNNPARSSLPEQFHLYQNYPNPFNPSTVVAYDLPVSTHVSLTIYNVLGKEVARLVDAEQRAGSYTVQWDGRALDGQQSPTGMYLVRLQATNGSETRRLVLIK